MIHSCLVCVVDSRISGTPSYSLFTWTELVSAVGGWVTPQYSPLTQEHTHHRGDGGDEINFELIIHLILLWLN